MNRSLLTLLGAGAVLVSTLPAATGWAQDEEKPYTVQDGKVDKATYNGYRRYGDACLRCHGPAGAGSSYAPALTDRLKEIPYERYAEVVINGLDGKMPAFGEVEDVATYMDDIYGYLKARSDGAIGASRPQRIPG